MQTNGSNSSINLLELTDLGYAAIVVYNAIEMRLIERKHMQNEESNRICIAICLPLTIQSRPHLLWTSSYN